MKTINKLIKERIRQENEYISEHNAIKKILTDQKGKQFNFRTFSKKNLKGFEFCNKYGMFYIKGKFEHLIGYRETKEVCPILFEKFDACHGSASKERINKMQNLDVKSLDKIYKKMYKSLETLRVCFGDLERQKFDSFNNPIYYDILREILPEDEKKSALKDFRLSDIYYLKK